MGILLKEGMGKKSRIGRTYALSVCTAKKANIKAVEDPSTHHSLTNKNNRHFLIKEILQLGIWRTPSMGKMSAVYDDVWTYKEWKEEEE